jgi:molybdopterin-guanine dinucleotide biosynthesis protein
LASPELSRKSAPCRLIVVGGHTRSIGKTQLVCDLIAALPSAKWVAGKITQYGHGVCATNGHDCDCAPTEHVVALDWESNRAGGTDSARFLQAGAARSFWLRTKQGYLAEGMPPLRDALASSANSGLSDGLNVIVESNSLLQFVKPSLYVTVFDAARDDCKDSARQMLDRADVFVFRRGLEDANPANPPWMQLPAQLLRQKPSLLQREGEPLPEPLFQLVKRILDSPASVFV